MIGPPPGTRVYLACGVTDMRRGFDSLSAQVESVLKLDPYGGAVFIFRGRRGDLLKGLYWDGQGLVLYAKRLEKGRFVWPQAKEGTVSLTAAQVSMLVEGIDWRQPVWTARPQTEIPDAHARNASGLHGSRISLDVQRLVCRLHHLPGFCQRGRPGACRRRQSRGGLPSDRFTREATRVDGGMGTLLRAPVVEQRDQVGTTGGMR